MANKVFTDESLATLVDETKSYVDEAVSGKSDSNHTHNYAGSSSAGGAATSANKLNTNAGSTTQPVYFENGVPKATTYSLGKSVPSDAKFTDTVYTLPEAGSSLGGVKSGGDVTISAGIITVNDDSHNHTISNVDNLQSSLDSKVPTSRTINGKALSGDITLSASDVGAATSGHTHSSYVNQNAFSNVTVGSSTIVADSTTDTLTIAEGTGISISADTTNDKVTITNSGVRSISTGSSNGTISVNTNGSSANVAVKGLGSAAYTASTAYDAAGTAQAKADAALASAKTYTDEKIDAIVGEGASTTLDTIGEISAAIEEHQDVTDALNAAIGNKVDKVSGKGLSTNDYTTAEKNKLAGIATGANNYTHPTTSGNKHIPSGGSSGQILRWSADGTAVWGEDNNTTYGVATSSTLGLVKSGTDITVDSSGNVSVNDDSHNHIISNIDGLQTALDGKAPTGHASTATTYGIGTNSNYGHVKLSDSTSSESSTSAGIAATPAAVKAAYDLASSKANSSHNHSGSEITSGTVAAARLPLASSSASGIVTTSAQTFAGDKTFAGDIITTDLRPSAAITSDIGTGMLPYRNTYTKNLYINSQVIGGSISHCGRFVMENVGTTTTKGLTRLEIGNFIEEGRDGNAQGCVQIFNNNTGSAIIGTTHDDDRDIYINLPENGGTLLTTKDAYKKTDTYSKTELDWTQIYDSTITSAVNSISNINISGYNKIMVAVKCVNTANSAARAGSVILKSSSGVIYQFPVWTNLFTTSAGTSAGMAEFDIINGYIICPYAARSIRTSNFLNPTEGGTADNLTNTGGGILKCTNWNSMATLTVSSLDQDANFYFNAGSRVMVWGCKA